MKPPPPRADLAAIASVLWQRWWIVAATTLAAFLLMVVYLNSATYRYTASVKLTLVQTSSGNLTSQLGSLGGLASVTGVRLPQSRSEQNFLVFTNNLNSPLAAEVLMRDPTIVRGAFYQEWDAERRQWVEPRPFLKRAADAVKSLLGLPMRPYQPPNRERMRAYLDDSLGIGEDVRKPIVGLSYSHRDPAFAQKLLGELVSGVDGALRARALERTRDNIGYLRRQLVTVQLAESRIALADALAAEEKERMAANSAAPFAGEPMSTVGVSDRPTWPKPTAFLAAALVLGALLGGIVALALGPKRVPRPSEWE